MTNGAQVGTLSVAATVCLIHLLSCAQETPPGPPGVKPGKRDFVWTVDTVNYPGSTQTTMDDIWGSSAQNLYITGHNERGYGKMFRYDGHSWQPVALVTAEGGFIRGPIDLSALDGRSASDIFAVGEHVRLNPNPPPNFLDSSIIIHFDGATWHEEQLPSRGRSLSAIAMNGSDVWAGGMKGTAFHYDGNSWLRADGDSVYGFRDLHLDDSAPLALAATFVQGSWTVRYLLHWTSNVWAVVDSFTEGVTPATFGHLDIEEIGGKLYSVGRGVFVTDGDRWSQIYGGTSANLTAIHGTRKEHMFAVGSNGTVVHFNGQDWQRITIPGGFTFTLSGVWCTEDEVFVLGNDGSKTFVYHGK